jgi:hypothetical protein
MPQLMQCANQHIISLHIASHLLPIQLLSALQIRADNNSAKAYKAKPRGLGWGTSLGVGLSPGVPMLHHARHCRCPKVETPLGTDCYLSN